MKYFKGMIYTAVTGAVIGLGIGFIGCPYERRLDRINEGKEMADNITVQQIIEKRKSIETLAGSLILGSSLLAAIAFGINGYQINRENRRINSGEKDG